LESGAFEIQIADTDGDEIAESAVSHMMALAEEEGLELTLELHAASPVRADPHRFRQILINLVSNALKYTEEGWVKVRSYQVGNHVVYEVQDSGAGISEEDMPKVFTAFEKTTVAMGRADSTGLGLPVSLGMAEAMGGTITANSIGEGHGSTFRLVLDAGTGQDPEWRMASLAGVAA
jgi:signal transduction histidine kinase